MEVANVRRGDIRNSEFAWKAKTYSWGKLCSVFPRGISPTDIDGTVEINGHFLHVEFKTESNPVPNGQRLYLERWLNAVRLNGVVFVWEHPVLKSLDPSCDITAASCWWWEPNVGGVAKLRMSPASDDHAERWLSSWVDHAQGKPNDFVRCCREKLGLYPPSQTSPFHCVGGTVTKPPFNIKVLPSQVTTYTT